MHSNWSSLYYSFIMGPGRCDPVPSPQSPWSSKTANSLKGQTSPTSQSFLSSKSSRSLLARKTDKIFADPTQQKKACCQLINPILERISKVFLIHFRKMRAHVSMAAVKSPTVSCCKHSSPGLFGIISQSGPARGSLSLSLPSKGTRLLAGKALLLKRHKHKPKKLPEASGCSECLRRGLAIISFEPCLPSSVGRRESTQYISILWINKWTRNKP